MDNSLYLGMRYTDYLTLVDGKWFLCAFDNKTNKKGLYTIKKKDLLPYNIDYDLLYDEDVDSEFDKNQTEFFGLEYNLVFISDMLQKKPLCYVFTEEDGHERVIFNNKMKYII